MNSGYQRTDRVSDVLKKEVSEVLAREVKDPRLHAVTITHVRVSKDLKNARFFFTTMKQGSELEALRAGLKSASGFVQRKLASRIHLRYTPRISFEYDISFDRGARMDSILKGIEEELKQTKD